MGYQERIKGTEKASPHTHPIPQVIRLLVIFKTTDPKGGLDNSQSHSANVFRVDYPCSEPRELTQKKMAEDSEGDIAFRFVDEND